MSVLTPEIAALYARTALGHVTREYPNKMDHVLAGPGDVQGPRALHPVFFGSFDWHSCVHGWWTLFTLYRQYPDMEEAASIQALADELFTPANIAAEVAYLARPESRGFERPYGWGWLLMLAAELDRHSTGEGHRWGAVLKPLTNAFVARFKAYLLTATYPVRVGTHYNSAFALRLAIEYADAVGDRPLASLCRRKATQWHSGDRDCQAWEPSQDEFLSPALMEAELMRVTLGDAAFADWFDRFLPRVSAGDPATLFQPARVSDRTDGKIAHLDGLNLSRGWCWRGIASALPASHAARPVAREAADIHLAAALPQVTGDYMGEHWLASFALLALLAPPR
jgi:hypothetical protein